MCSHNSHAGAADTNAPVRNHKRHRATSPGNPDRTTRYVVSAWHGNSGLRPRIRVQSLGIFVFARTPRCKGLGCCDPTPRIGVSSPNTSTMVSFMQSPTGTGWFSNLTGKCGPRCPRTLATTSSNARGSPQAAAFLPVCISRSIRPVRGGSVRSSWVDCLHCKSGRLK